MNEFINKLKLPIGKLGKLLKYLNYYQKETYFFKFTDL